MAIVFRDTILGGFDLGFGDRGDAIIEISILEHWRSVLTGAAPWNQPNYFHPHTGTLGYNDGYLLSGVIYSAWRIGFDPFLSDTLTAFTWRTIGYGATLYLVRGVLRWSWGCAILIAVLATISNNMFLQAGHAQINSLALLPLFASLAILTVRAEIEGNPKARLYAALAALLFGLWLLTAFYFAWFTFYFCVVLAACWLVVTKNHRPSALLALIRAHWRTGATFVGVGVIAAIPFLAVYLPKRLETGGHGFMVSYLVQPVDPVNVGEGNLLWGWIASAIRWAVQGTAQERAFLDWEHHSGFPLLLFALACAAGWRAIRRPGPRFACAFALAIAVSWVLTMRVWQVSPWILVHHLLPGASGVRVVLRYQLFLTLPVLLLAGMAFRERLSQTKPLIAAGIVALLVLEQINVASPATLSRKEQLRDFALVPRPPADCRAFYIVTARAHEPPPNPLYPHNVDAMFLAAQWRLPTFNGFSTFNPPDWDFADSFAADYDQRAMVYARAYRLTGLCRLDMRDAQPWSLR